MAEWVTNVPNSLTLARIALAVPMAMCYTHGLTGAAFVIFVLSCLSDYADGWWARRYHAETEWGRKADPVADKVCVYAVFIVCLDAFADESVFIASAGVIAVYDCIVIWMRRKLERLKTGRIAKWKTFVLMSACTSGFFSMAVADIPVGGSGIVHSAALILFAAAAMLAIASVTMYFREHRAFLLRHSAVPAE